MGIKKRIKKVIFSLALTAIMCITFTGCELPFDTIWPESSDNQISNKAYPQSAASTEDIIQYISDADNVCEIFVEDETLIDANLWLSSIDGIEQLKCEYKRVKNGFNVRITYDCWDSFAIIKAYRSDSLSGLNERQLTLYNKYIQVLDSVTSPSNTDIENELVKNVTSLLMELGTGFAFMGQQYHLEVGGKDFYIDLLFYNTKLRCYVAIDLKTGEFKPEQAGKMNFYLSALDDLVKAPEDNPSVGLILCRDENRTIAEYALRDMSKPIGVSEYHLCTDLPLDLKNALPAVEDIRSRIDMKK